MELKEMKALYSRAKKAYYNSQPIMSDVRFDRLENAIKKLAPNWPLLHKTGTSVSNKKTEVKLPQFMPSLGKAYPEALPKWLKGNPNEDYILMEKLDGSALYLQYDKGAPTKLITRGDGTLGGDISFLIPSLRLPKISHRGKVELRCEAVIPKDRFKKWASQFDNSRNLVNGLLNRRVAHEANTDIDIVVLGVFGQPLLKGLMFARQQGFHTVTFLGVTQHGAHKPNTISHFLQHRKKVSPYEIDGLVITGSNFNYKYDSADKPKGIIAFKENLEKDAPEVEVLKVLWQVSHNSRLIPKIEITPTKMEGVTVKFVTCNNAKWLTDRGIGPGAKVKVLRSGGVIPKIVEVVKRAKKAATPGVAYKTWGVHYILAGKVSASDKRDVQSKRILRFFKYLGVDGIKARTIENLYDQGFNTPFHYMKYKGNSYKFAKLGLGPKQASKLANELEDKLSEVDLMKLMAASTCFAAGVGERRLSSLQKAGVSLTKLVAGMPATKAKALILGVPGFQEKTADLILSGLPAFAKFLDTAKGFISVKESVPIKKAVRKGKLSGKLISFTGYRSKEEELAIEKAGGEVVAFSSKTQILLIRAGGKASDKINKAKERGIKVLNFAKLGI